MRSRSIAAVMVAVALAGLWGCASAPRAPHGWLPTAPQSRSDPRGGWIEVGFLGADRRRHHVEGELLAIDGEHIHVEVADSLYSVARGSAPTATLTYFDPRAGKVATLTLLGTISTISHGGFLILTAPAWLIAGTAATGNRSDDGRVTDEETGWEEFRRYARFPQGLPPSFEGHGKSPPPVPRPEAEGAPAPEPAGPALRRGPATAFWFDVAAGVGFHTEPTGAGFVFGANLAHRAVMVGTRLSVVHRDSSPYRGGDYDFSTSGETFDLALLLGLRGTYRSVHASISAGPASYSSSIGDLSLGDVIDFSGSLAAQAELFFLTGHYVGVGTVLTANWNDVRDFYVISFGLAVGIP